MPEGDGDARVSVRVAGGEDAAEVTRLMIAFRDWWEREQPGDESFAAGVARLLDDPLTEFLLAVPDDGAAVGVCQLRYRYGLWYDAADCWLEDIYVDERAQRLGVGRALADAALEQARKWGCRRMQLDVTETNEPAVAFYRRLGFESWSGPAGGGCWSGSGAFAPQ